MKARVIIVVVSFFGLVLWCSTSRMRKEMIPGERLFRANCRSCHTLPNPKSFHVEEWLQKHQDRTQLTDQELQAIIEYLQNKAAETENNKY